MLPWVTLNVFRLKGYIFRHCHGPLDRGMVILYNLSAGSFHTKKLCSRRSIQFTSFNSIMTNGKSTTAFSTRYRRSAYLTSKSLKGGSKTIFLFSLNKVLFQSNKVCYKVSSYSSYIELFFRHFLRLRRYRRNLSKSAFFEGGGSL